MKLLNITGRKIVFRNEKKKYYAWAKILSIFRQQQNEFTKWILEVRKKKENALLLWRSIDQKGETKTWAASLVCLIPVFKTIGNLCIQNIAIAINATFAESNITVSWYDLMWIEIKRKHLSIHSSLLLLWSAIETRIKTSEILYPSLSHFSTSNLEELSIPRIGRVLWIRTSQFFHALGRSFLLNLRKTSDFGTIVLVSSLQTAGAIKKYSISPFIKLSIDKTAFFANHVSGGCEESFIIFSWTISVRTTHGPIVLSVSKSSTRHNEN